MNEFRPAWADDLAALLMGIRGGPRPLLRLLAIHAGTEVAPTDLEDYIRNADENDPALTQLRLSIAGWDSSDQLVLANEEVDATPAHSIARRQAIYAALQLPPDVFPAIEARVPLFEKPAIVISRVFEPWYAKSRTSRSSVYWNDYEAYLRDVKKWKPEAIAALDATTTDVVQRLSDPTRVEAKQTKGLVVGYVQSGKTANFTGVVAKAIDAGYRLIIVLTGTIEILRAQTQRRMDMELIGVENILSGQDPSDPAVLKEMDYQQDPDWIGGRFVSHGAALDQPGVVSISRVTTHRDDYKRLPQGLTRLKFMRANKAKPLNDEANLFSSDAYLAIIKKNRAPLQKLIKDLTPLKSDLGQLPVLIIDDESDQASVDTTNPQKYVRPTAEDRNRTAINKLITEILHLCPRAQYVGYTATPFANVFVDPEDERDLFPADFVLSLYRPAGYMGVQEFHDVGKLWDEEARTVANSNELAFVRGLQGDKDADPAGRESELHHALDAWVLSGAIKKFRESADPDLSFRHHTMLVHESVRQVDHSATAEDVRVLWRSAQYPSAAALERLQKLYESDFLPVMRARANGLPVPRSFDDLRPFISQAIQEMSLDGDPVLVVNSDKAIHDQQKKLDFEGDKVWRILVGGTQLSRGFTVEGLTTSYFRRKAGQADTLMQAGRWFGFRPGYEDLVRLYIRRDESIDLYDAFEALLMDEEAFREELRQYEGFDDEGMPLVEPRQIPPLVSQHLPWLKPTARNKMWNAVIQSKASTGGLEDRYSVPPRGDAGNKRNLLGVGAEIVRATTRVTRLDYELGDGSSGRLPFKFGLIPADRFLTLFQGLEWHPDYLQAVEPFTNFLSTATNDGRIIDWAMLWHRPQKVVGTIEVAGVEAPVVKRSRRTPPRIDFVGSDAKHRAAASGIARGESVADLDGAEGRGVGLLYLVDDRVRLDEPLSVDNVVPLLSLAAPTSATPSRRDLIKWTVRVPSQRDEAAVRADEVRLLGEA